MRRRSLSELRDDILWGVSWCLVVATVFAGIAVGMYIVGLLRNRDVLWLLSVIVSYYVGGVLAGAAVGVSRRAISQYVWVSYVIAGLGGFFFSFAGMVMLEGSPIQWQSWIWWGIALVTGLSSYHGGADLRRGVRWEDLRQSGRLEHEESKKTGRRIFRRWPARDE